jgi:hypothetical protein
LAVRTEYVELIPVQRGSFVLQVGYQWYFCSAVSRVSDSH